MTQQKPPATALLTITDQLECDLEPETEQLLSALKRPGTGFDDLMDTAL